MPFTTTVKRKAQGKIPGVTRASPLHPSNFLSAYPILPTHPVSPGTFTPTHTSSPQFLLGARLHPPLSRVPPAPLPHAVPGDSPGLPFRRAPTSDWPYPLPRQLPSPPRAVPCPLSAAHRMGPERVITVSDLGPNCGACLLWKRLKEEADGEANVPVTVTHGQSPAALQRKRWATEGRAWGQSGPRRPRGVRRLGVGL